MKELLLDESVKPVLEENEEDILYGMDLAYWFYIGNHPIYFVGTDGVTKEYTGFVHYFIDKKFERRKAVLKCALFNTKRFKENHSFWYNYIPTWEKATQNDSFLNHIEEMEFSQWALDYALEHHGKIREKGRWVDADATHPKYKAAVKKQKKEKVKVIPVKEVVPESNVIKVEFGKKKEETVET